MKQGIRAERGPLRAPASMNRRGNCVAENLHDLYNVPSYWLQSRLAGSSASTRSATPCTCRIMIFLMFPTKQGKERFSCKKTSYLQRSLGMIPQVCGSEVDWLHYVTLLIHKESYLMFCFPLSQIFTWLRWKDLKKNGQKMPDPHMPPKFSNFWPL